MWGRGEKEEPGPAGKNNALTTIGAAEVGEPGGHVISGLLGGGTCTRKEGKTATRQIA